MSKTQQYELLDSGRGRKLERWGDFVLDRPCAQAVWRQQRPRRWRQADATFDRLPRCRWKGAGDLPEIWEMEIDGIVFRVSPTDFGHLGVFPEQRENWRWLQNVLQSKGKPYRVLNLFAYSGGSTLAAAKAGCEVTHLDASKGMVDWARDNARRNGLEQAPIRWIVDDVSRFLQREIKRQQHYDAILLDPPSFGRGSKGQVFKIEKHLPELLSQCRQLLSEQPRCVLLSTHTPGYTPMVLQHLLQQELEGLGGTTEAGELLLEGEEEALFVPSGTYARWWSDA